MVDTREITYYGLSIKVEPTDERPFYLTGSMSNFKIKIANLEDKNREGKVLIRIRYSFGESSPIRNIPIVVKLGPKEVSEHSVEEWHQFDGLMVFTIYELGSPEKYVSMTEEDFLRQVSNSLGIISWDVLCSYRVMDRATYEEEKNRHEELLKEQRAIKEGLEKLREDIMQTARDEARKEVLGRLAESIKLAFSGPSPEEKKEKKPSSNIYG